MKEDILREAFDNFRFAEYPSNDTLMATLQAMEKYGEEVLKIAAEKDNKKTLIFRHIGYGSYRLKELKNILPEHNVNGLFKIGNKYYEKINM